MSTDFKPLPAMFAAHGSPMNTLELNPETRALREWGKRLPRPKLILALSAHWTTRGVRITGAEQPQTIHDFYGFPPALFAFQYPAPGSRAWAERIAALLAPLSPTLDEEWGLDHGTWSVLAHLYPDADVPVIQLSLDDRQPPEWHYALGQLLSPLRDEGVLIIGSGNVVHNLRTMDWQRPDYGDPAAKAFNDRIAQALSSVDHETLKHYLTLGSGARLAVPTPEHYLPLLTIAGLQRPGEPVTLFNDVMQYGTIGMLSCVVGA